MERTWKRQKQPGYSGRNAVLTPMKLPELKERTFMEWQDYCEYQGVLLQPETFKPEIRQQFGDLRKKDTWEKALCRFRGLNAQIGLLDAHKLILQDFNFTRDRWDYEYRYRILEEFLMLPDGLGLIRLGLEQLFSADFTPRQREGANGFFELVQSAGRRELAGIANEPFERPAVSAGAC